MKSFKAWVHSNPLSSWTLLSFLLFGLHGLLGDHTPAWDGVIYHRAAKWLAVDNIYSYKFYADNMPPTPTAFYPVGWPFLLSLGYRLHAPWLMEWIASAALPPVVYAYSRSHKAALAVLLWPSAWLFSFKGMSEPLFVLTTVLGVFAHQKKQEGLAGLVFGLAGLVRPIALLWALGFFFVSKEKIKYACGVLLMVLPWSIRNHQELGTWSTATNSGYNLLLGSHKNGLYEPLDPKWDCPRGTSEVARDQCRTNLALSRIQAAPFDQSVRVLKKISATFLHESAGAFLSGGPVSSSVPSVPSVPSGSSGSFGGSFFLLVLTNLYYWALVFLLCKSGRAWHAPHMIILFVGTLLLHGLVMGGDRYHLPLIPFFIVLLFSNKSASAT